MRTHMLAAGVSLVACLALVSEANSVPVGGSLQLPGKLGMSGVLVEQAVSIVSITTEPPGVIANPNPPIFVKGAYNTGGGPGVLVAIPGGGGVRPLKNLAFVRFRTGMSTQVLTTLTARYEPTAADVSSHSGIRVWSATGCMEYRWDTGASGRHEPATTCERGIQ